MSENSLTHQLESLNRYNENIVKLSNAYLEAITSQKKTVSVDVENADGTTTTILIPSNIYLSNELDKLTQTLRSISGLSNGGSNIVASDNSTFREIFVTSYRKSFVAPTNTSIYVDPVIKLSTNQIVESLLSPLTEVEFGLTSDYANSRMTKIKKFVITDGDFSVFSDGMQYGQVRQILSTGDYQFTEQEYDKLNQSNISRFYGNFDVISTEILNDNTIRINLNKLTYSDELNVVPDSKQLDIADAVTSIQGDIKLRIVSVNTLNQSIVCQFESGVGSVNTGQGQLSILSPETFAVKIRVPVRLGEQSIIFLSPIDSSTGFASSKSSSKVFDSTLFTVTENGDTFMFNEYFASKVADIGGYFESIIRESLIPATLGEKPAKPELSTQDFTVVQINSHLTNTPNADKLKKLQLEKDVINSQISSLTTAIGILNTKIAQGNYSTEAKRTSDEALRQSKINEKLQKTALLGSIVADIRTQLTNTAERSISPKYRARGFWPVQGDIPSAITNPQKIVQNQIRYRYVSNTGNTANATQVTYADGENTVSATFTPWIIVKTEPLERIVNENGSVQWVANSPTDADKVNINQLDIPIQYGESVEIQVRAMSEAGWPTSSVMSDWSDLIRVDFPVELLQESDIASIARNNSDDTINVRLQQEFANQGISAHIAESIQEQDKYFAHDARKLASGFVTAEQKIISIYDYTTLLESRLKFLEEKVDRRYATITAQIVDEAQRIYDVNSFGTVRLFAGYYTDEVDLTEPSNFGSIVTKTFYLRLINRNAQTVEMLSISPGNLTLNAGSALYDTVPILVSGSNEVSPQKNGQIFYNRNMDVAGNEAIYVTGIPQSDTEILQADIDTSAAESLKNVVHLNQGIIEKVKLIDSASLQGYVALTHSHPAYQNFVELSDSTLLDQEFERIQNFNTVYRAALIQNVLSEDLIMKFDANDKWLVGQNSVGASLFSNLASIQSYQVNGIDAGSSKEIYSGEQDSVLIPIVFQYRMTDALGKPDGSTSLSANSNFEYIKRIGIDLLVAGNKFTFDVVVSAKFRPTSVSNNSLGIQTIGSINTTNTPNIN